MAAISDLTPIARTRHVMVIAGAGLRGASRPAFTTRDLAARPSEVQAAFDSQWRGPGLSEAQIAIKREFRERVIFGRGSGAARFEVFTTATDSNLNAGEPFPPARHLRGRGSIRRCLACGSRWTPLDPTGKPAPCCLATSRTAVALADEVPVGRVVQDARAAAAVADVIVGVAVEARDRIVLDQILVPGPEAQERILIDRDPPATVAACFELVVEADPAAALLVLFPWRPTAPRHPAMTRLGDRERVARRAAVRPARSQ